MMIKRYAIQVVREVREDWNSRSLCRKILLLLKIAVEITIGVVGVIFALKFADSVESGDTNWIYFTAAVLCIIALMVFKPVTEDEDE